MAPTAEWSHFSHDADIGVCGVGSTLAEAFEQVGLALTAVLVPPSSLRATDPVSITCEAPDPEMLLVDWLNELIYEMAVGELLFARFDVQLDGHRLQATAWAEPLDRKRHAAVVEVKGATFTGLRVCTLPDGRWQARCVVDV